MYLIVEKFNNVDWGASKVKGRVSHVLYEPQIEHLSGIGKWPEKWKKATKEEEKREEERMRAAEERDTGSLNDSDNSLDLPDNPNRRVEEDFSEDEYSI